MSSAVTLFLSLLVGHAVCDYPLQGDFLAKAKNHKAAIPGVPAWQALVWHAMIHAGCVGYITGAVALGAFEFFAHVAIDYAKCDNEITFNQDQALHVVCKAAWVVALMVR